MLLLGPMFDYLTGKHGIGPQVVAGVVYTTACVCGSLFAHWLAMKTEKGKNAVGANKLYAQIPVKEWELVVTRINGLGAIHGYKSVGETLAAKETGATRGV